MRGVSVPVQYKKQDVGVKVNERCEVGGRPGRA